LNAEPLVVLGLMSGTSADGVDGAVLRFEKDKTPELVLGRSRSYSEKLRRSLLQAPEISLAQMAALHVEVAEAFADLALECQEEAKGLGCPLSLVASHGQTVFHHSGKGPRVSIQIGEADRLAGVLGLPVVFDFRAADLAAGGEGAPLVPAGDLDLFGHGGRPLAILNLGGIANLTLLGPGEEECMAWDVGPANCLSDSFCRKRYPKGPGFDRDGRLALSGSPHPDFLARLLAHPFFKRTPPKSTGREAFGDRFLEDALAMYPQQSPEDVLAAFAMLLGRSVAADLARLPQEWQPKRLLVAGGGIRNAALMKALRGSLASTSDGSPSRPSIPVESSQSLGVDPKYREAACFAALGRRALLNLPGSFPNTTGAQKPTVLGKWAFPSRPSSKRGQAV